jgi:hypothetical protein
MKKIILTSLFAIATTFIYCQIDNVEIVEFNAPYESINVNVDGKVYEYFITSKTKFTSTKSGEMPRRYYCKGSFADLEFEIIDRKRFAKKIKLKSDYTPGKEKINGILEYYDGDMAYIDGRKVLLDNSTKIECSKKKECGCTKGMTYLGYDELTIGDFLKITGDSDESGAVLANKIQVCENVLTPVDKLLRTNVTNSYNSEGVRIVQSPSGIVVPPNSLSQGKIKMGIIEYKLKNDIQIQGYVNVIGNKVIPIYAKDQEYKERHDVFFRFYVIDDPIPNAYAFPNGMVFIHTGLLKIIENEAQLAVVLGHEVAHVTYEHASQRMKKNEYTDSKLVKSSSNRLLGKFFNKRSDGSLSGDVLEGVGDAVMATKPSDISNLFNQDSESQADRVGLYYAFSSGYDIREAINFWRKMEDVTKDAGYQNSLEADVKKLLLSTNMNVGGKGVSELATDMTSSIVGNFLNTIYTSHPNAVKRLRDISDLINTVYLSEELNLNKGVESYKKRTSKL